jgi:hypothetical protein
MGMGMGRGRTSLLFRKRERLPVLPLELFQLLVHGRLLGRTQRGPLSFYVRQWDRAGRCRYV